ncbi:hypothetical protein COCC4DRAFT_24407 [Bipolaris maydis ATCC 48331]|uniref:Uncharacterized protein n=1 Tax=Cochliobolus heterostrophus (strain C4 / ATCC 48331 / race T) TaxID=665024 RepID=N4X5Y3_COCH4|nr:uncharacterized protein COCC4DRAFT_24407 [Bipolaris maydis ATCC 48331]ENI03873.1 hypothetical protein COCC4DRAFT_24407 [Bipolaris maydis ATCC 48331]
MMFTKTLVFAFISTALAFPEGVLVSNGLTGAPKIITRDITRFELTKRESDPTVILIEDHPTNPLLARQNCNTCIPNGCGACRTLFFANIGTYESSAVNNVAGLTNDRKNSAGHVVAELNKGTKEARPDKRWFPTISFNKKFASTLKCRIWDIFQVLVGKKAFLETFS